MKKLSDYIMFNSKKYKFNVKIASEVTDEHINMLEDILKKYGVEDITKPKKTIFHTNPIDFPNIKASELWLFDITLKYPTTVQNLIEDVKKCMMIEENRIVIYNANNPPVDKNASETIYDDERSGKVSKMEDYKDVPQEEITGPSYTENFLKAINKYSKDNPIMSEYKGK